MRYAVIIEKGERNFSAYAPELPGGVATGKTLEEVKRRMGEAVELHLRGGAKTGRRDRSRLAWPITSRRRSPRP